MQKTITIKEATNWITKMAAKDGVISTNERKLLKEFAEAYNIDPNYLYRLAHAHTKKNEQEVIPMSQSEIKGLHFEEFIVSLLNDRSLFKLLAWRSDKISGNVYAAENLHPDLLVSHTIDGIKAEYFIECKYRSSWNSGKIDLSTQLIRYYKHAQRENKALFIALGIGGTPSSPDKLYIIPAEKILHKQIVKRNLAHRYLCPQTTTNLHQHIANLLTPKNPTTN